MLKRVDNCWFIGNLIVLVLHLLTVCAVCSLLNVIMVIVFVVVKKLFCEIKLLFNIQFGQEKTSNKFGLNNI